MDNLHVDILNILLVSNTIYQGPENAPSLISTRMIFIYMMVASVVLFENFSASYTSFLSVVTQAKPFETIAGLEQTSFTIGAQAGTAYRTMFTVGGVRGQGPSTFSHSRAS